MLTNLPDRHGQASGASFCVWGNSAMRRMMVLAAAGAVVVTVGAISFTFGRALTVREPVATAMPAKVAEPELVTGTIVSRPIPAPAQPVASPANRSEEHTSELQSRQ